MRKECEYICMPCYKDTPIDSLDCVKCLVGRAYDCTNIADVLMHEQIKKRDKILEGFKEVKEWVAKDLLKDL